MELETKTIAAPEGREIKEAFDDFLRAFDAFPMTHHVECLATLTRGPGGS